LRRAQNDGVSRGGEHPLCDILIGGEVQYPAREVASFILDGNEYQCQLHADFIGNERILGRDVLNSLEVLFRGPSGEVVINP
jgi:hypothetical protein